VVAAVAVQVQGQVEGGDQLIFQVPRLSADFPADERVFCHARGQGPLALDECLAGARADAPQLDPELVGQKAAQSLAQCRALGVPGIVRLYQAPQGLATGGAAVARRLGWADPDVQQREPVVPMARSGLHERRRPTEPPTVHAARGRDRRRPGQGFLPRYTCAGFRKARSRLPRHGALRQYVLTARGVVPIRTATGKAGRLIKAGSPPDDIAITPNGRTAYVADALSGTVTPIRTATDTALTPIKFAKSVTVAYGPPVIAITPNGTTAYIAAGLFSGYVTPIRIATDTALKPIKVGTIVSNNAIAITPDTATAYVTGVTFAGGYSRLAVTAIRTATNTISKVITDQVQAANRDLRRRDHPERDDRLPAQRALRTGAPYGTVNPLRIATGTVGTPITVGAGPAAIVFTK
jgi:hypothetical protein